MTAPRDESVASEAVSTEYGLAQGCQVDGIRIFRGLPYGASTAGPNRFRPPQPPTPWTGIREARLYGSTAPQPDSWLAIGGFRGNRPSIGEDCLSLNVWTPGCDDARRPVLVWFHGGGFEAGSGSSLLYDGVNIGRRGDVVLVTVNHRLGVFGYCQLDGEEGSGNAGILDLIAALRWVHENIAGFGGDPGNVTIFGQSGGGRKVSTIMATPAAAGLFERGIVQSGSHLKLLTRERAAELTDHLRQTLGLASVEGLRDVPMERLIAAGREIALATRAVFSPVLDDVVFTSHPWDPVAPDTSAGLPLLVGTTRTELSNLVGAADPSTLAIAESDLVDRLTRYVDGDDAPALIEAIRQGSPGASPSEVFFTVGTARTYGRASVLMAERKARQAKAPVWAYELDWRTPVEGGRMLSPHMLDLPFIFDNVALGAFIVGPETPVTARLADEMAGAWLAFARSGDPGWAPYDLDQRTTMVFDTTSRPVADPHHDERLIMEKYEPRTPSWTAQR